MKELGRWRGTEPWPLRKLMSRDPEICIESPPDSKLPSEIALFEGAVNWYGGCFIGCV